MRLSANSLLCFLLALTVLTACDPEEVSFPLGSDFIEENSRLVFIDTFSLRASTMMEDSIPTIDPDQILVGHYTDSLFGEVQAAHYLRLGHKGPLNSEKTYYFDSLVLILPYSGYLQGDSSRSIPIAVHRLTEEIELDDDNLLHNVSEFPYHPAPLGVGWVYPEPRQSDELRIRLADSLGIRWLRQMSSGDETFSAIDNFYEEFAGLAILTDTTENTAVIGFKRFVSDLTLYDSIAAARVRLYYREEGLFAAEKTYDFTVRDSRYRFNHISSKRNGTLLTSLRTQREDVSETHTNDEVFFHAGLGIMPRIEFPELDALYRLGPGAIVKAELVLEPIPSSYSRREPLPDSLILIETDRINRLGKALLSDAGRGFNYPLLLTDYLYKTETEYRFSITNYLKRIFQEPGQEHALCISMPVSSYQHSLQNLRLGGTRNSTYPLRLEIYYAISDEE